MFDPQILRGRLANSNETADSITATAQWILFYKRHAEEIAREWASAVTNDKNKLAEIYIANEVIQQSKIKRRGEFAQAFGVTLPQALEAAYAQSDPPVKDRIQRVVKVWRDRTIFTPEEQNRIEESVGMRERSPAGASAAPSTASTPGTSTPPGAIPSDLTKLVSEYSKLVSASDDKTRESVRSTVRSTLQELLAGLDKVGASKSQEPTQEANKEEEDDVYTAQDAQQSSYQDNNDDDDEEMQYASDNEEPPEKKQKVGVDPKLASFLASLSKS